MTEPARRVVDLDRLKIPFAIDAGGRWVKAPDVDLAAPPVRPRCPGCGDVVTFRRGSAGRIPHFAHRPNASCSTEGYEGLSHQKLKEVTAVLVDELGADALLLAPPAETRDRRGAMLEEVYPGTGGLRSDVGVPLADGKLLGFEIVVAHDLSIRKVNAATAAGNLVCRMNGFAFTEHIIANGEKPEFDLDRDARAFVLQWLYALQRGTAPGTRMAAPAGVAFVGGTAVNCDAMPSGDPVGGSAPLRATEWFTGAEFDRPAPSTNDTIARQHALRLWHANPEIYPLTFLEHLERGELRVNE